MNELEQVRAWCAEVGIGTAIPDVAENAEKIIALCRKVREAQDADLLAALKLVRACGNGGAKLTRQASDAVRAAIAKAEGAPK